MAERPDGRKGERRLRSARSTQTRRSAATCACSARCSGGCSSSRRARSCSPPRSGSGRLRAPRRAGGSARRAREAVRALDVDGQAKVLRAFALYFQLANLAEQHHRIRRRRAVRARGARSRASRSTRPSRGSARPASTRRSCGERPRDVSLELVLTAHPTEATRAHVRSRRTCASPSCSPRSTTRRCRPRAARRSRRRSPRRSRCSGRPTRCASERPRVVDEIRHGLWFFEESLLRGRAERLLAELPRAAFPDAPLPFSLRHAGSAATRTATRTRRPARSRRRSSAPARSRSRRYRDEVRELAARDRASQQLARRASRASCSTRSRATRRAAGLRAPRSAPRTTGEPYRRKLSFMWCAARQRRATGVGRERARWPTSRVDRPQPRATAASASPTGGSPRCGGASSCSASTSRSSTSACTPTTCTRPAERVRATLRGGRARRGAHGSTRARHGHRLGHDLADDVLAVLELADEPVVASCRCSRRSTTCARGARRSCDELADERGFARRRRVAGRPPRGDGRLLRLGQGRRLPGRAVGDLPRAGGARRRRRASAASS